MRNQNNSVDFCDVAVSQMTFIHSQYWIHTVFIFNRNRDYIFSRLFCVTNSGVLHKWLIFYLKVKNLLLWNHIILLRIFFSSRNAVGTTASVCHYFKHVSVFDSDFSISLSQCCCWCVFDSLSLRKWSSNRNFLLII